MVSSRPSFPATPSVRACARATPVVCAAVCYDKVTVSGGESVSANSMGTFTKEAGLVQGGRPVYKRVSSVQRRRLLSNSPASPTAPSPTRVTPLPTSAPSLLSSRTPSAQALTMRPTNRAPTSTQSPPSLATLSPTPAPTPSYEGRKRTGACTCAHVSVHARIHTHLYLPAGRSSRTIYLSIYTYIHSMIDTIDI
jgi:hypothetical protein